VKTLQSYSFSHSHLAHALINSSEMLGSIFWLLVVLQTQEVL
jgi:hypothetical protein